MYIGRPVKEIEVVPLPERVAPSEPVRGPERPAEPVPAPPLPVEPLVPV